MLDLIRISWSALRGVDLPGPGRLTITTLPGSFESDVLLGLDAEGREHLLIDLGGASFDLDAFESPALHFSLRPLEVRDRAAEFLDIQCSMPSASEIFDHFVAAVGERLAAGGAAIHEELAAVLRSWRELLTPAKAPLTASLLRPVYAELLVLRDLALVDPTRAISAWTGPAKSRHDFRDGAHAIEVKVTTSHTSRTVRIHGVDQLEIPEAGTLELHLVRLEMVPGGEDSVRTLVDELLDLGCDAERLFAGLSKSGVPSTSLDEAAKFSFDVRERLTYRISADTPRIVAASFVGSTVPTPVGDLSYEYDLGHLVEIGGHSATVLSDALWA